MTLYKKKPLPKRKVKKGLAGIVAIPAAGAVAGEAVSGAGALPSAIVVGAIADYNRRKNGDWLLDLVYTSPTGTIWLRPIPSEPVVEVVEETPAEPVREEVHRPFRIDPVINIGVQAPDIDWGYDRSGIERVLDYGRAKIKSFYAEDTPEVGSDKHGLDGPRKKPTARRKPNRKSKVINPDRMTSEKKTNGTPKWNLRLWSWTKKQYNKGKDLWDKTGRFGKSWFWFKGPMIYNLAHDARNWDNMEWYEKLSFPLDVLPYATFGKFVLNGANSKLANKAFKVYDLALDENNNNEGNLSEEKTDTVSAENPKQENDGRIQVKMVKNINTRLNGVDLKLKTDTI